MPPIRRANSGKPSLAPLFWLSRASLAAFVVLWYALISTTDESFPTLLRDSSLLLQMNATTAHGAVPVVVPPDIIGFAVTITDCGVEFPIEDAASVLQFSLNRVSIHGSGRYDFVLYAIYHPDAEDCVKPLEGLGYTLLKRDTPVNVQDIQGEFLREKIEGNGCCGAKELIKLEAFTLTQHKIVVLLDLDVLILKPLDRLFDFMLYGTPLASDHFQTNATSAIKYDDINMAYTLDYNMVNPERPIKPIQGGFVVFKPNQTIYDDMVGVVLKGNYNSRGWEGKTGKFWGSMTWQGLLPYYYHVLHRNTSVELNRCIYDNMVQDPRFSELRARKNETERKCYTDTCEDCRHRQLPDIYSAHFTVCMKPWTCSRLVVMSDAKSKELCRQLHHAWFGLRSEMEQSWGRSGLGRSKEWGDKDHFFGFCHEVGMRGYQKVERPFGKPLLK